MKNFERILMGTAIVIVATALPAAHADLVYEYPVTDEAPRMDDREATRSAIKTSKRMNDSVTVAQSTVVMENAPMSQPAVVPASQTPGQPIESLSRSELLRRERLREELTNEDLVQERLEQLRLRDEQKRLDQMFNKQQAEQKTSEPVAPAPVVIEEQTVIVPPTDEAYADTAGEDAVVVIQPKGKKSKKGKASDEVVVSQSNVIVADASDESEKTLIQVTPRFGVSNMSSANTLKVSGRFSTGLGIGIHASDQLVFELGYAYSEYGIELANAYQTGSWMAPNGNLETRALKQNVFDLGLKVYLVDSDSKFRPFIGGGGGYSKSYLNFDDQYAQWANQWNQTGYTDYEISSFLGQVSTGFEVQINKNISAGLTFRYYKVLSSRESNGIPPQAFWGNSNYGNPYSFNNVSQSDAGNQYAGNSLAKQSFYSILAGVSFTF